MSGGANQINVEYFFRLLYDCLRGSCYGIQAAEFSSFLAHLWIWITIIGYIASIVGLVVIVYCLVRIFELREREKEEYGTLLLAPAESEINPRWTQIESLMTSVNPSSWREAILEADIMLDDILTRQGYAGEGVGEKLQQVEPSDFSTLQDAWEAHKVRNAIAHQGSSFDLSQVLAQRTISRYGAVFREFGAI